MANNKSNKKFPKFPKTHGCMHCGGEALKVKSEEGTHEINLSGEVKSKIWYEAVYKCSVCGKHTGLSKEKK